MLKILLRKTKRSFHKVERGASPLPSVCSFTGLSGHPMVSPSIRARETTSAGPPLRSSLIPTHSSYALVAVLETRPKSQKSLEKAPSLGTNLASKSRRDGVSGRTSRCAPPNRCWCHSDVIPSVDDYFERVSPGPRRAASRRRQCQRVTAGPQLKRGGRRSLPVLETILPRLLDGGVSVHSLWWRRGRVELPVQ